MLYEASRGLKAAVWGLQYFHSSVRAWQTCATQRTTSVLSSHTTHNWSCPSAQTIQPSKCGLRARMDHGLVKGGMGRACCIALSALAPLVSCPMARWLS